MSIHRVGDWTEHLFDFCRLNVSVTARAFGVSAAAACSVRTYPSEISVAYMDSSYTGSIHWSATQIALTDARREGGSCRGRSARHLQTVHSRHPAWCQHRATALGDRTHEMLARLAGDVDAVDSRVRVEEMAAVVLVAALQCRVRLIGLCLR
jgi:hypothetical protein